MRYPKVYPVGQGQVPIAFGGKDAKAQRVFRDVLIYSSVAITYLFRTVLLVLYRQLHFLIPSFAKLLHPEDRGI